MSEDEWDGGGAPFHGAFFKIQALRQLWDRANSACLTNDYVDWKRYLDIIYRELIFTLQTGKKKDKRNTQRILAVACVTSLKTIQEAKARVTGAMRDAAYNAVVDYDVFLRDVQADAGLDMPKGDDPRLAFRK